MPRAWLTGGFDDFRSWHVRLLDEAAACGELHVLLWSDRLIGEQTGQPPKFPEAERRYLVEAMRYVHAVTIVDHLEPPGGFPPATTAQGDVWVLAESQDIPVLRQLVARAGCACRVIPESTLQRFPEPPPFPRPASPRKKVVVTGCFDWFHSGHVRFFEEVSELGDLYVVVGNDANIRYLKGAGHPLFPQNERRYVVGAVRYVTAALISSGMGWLDAEPEIRQLRPDIYAVNEDGDKPEKREFCRMLGLEYVVLKRVPKAGLPRRESTRLRGF